MRRGTIRAAVLSASALSLAAATWIEVSKEYHRAFGKRQPRLLATVAVSHEDGKTLVVRDAAWSLTLFRLLLDLGDCAPPFLTAASAAARDPAAPAHHARRAFASLGIKWPLDAALTSEAAGVAAERRAAKDASAILPSAFLRRKLRDGGEDTVFSVSGVGSETRGKRGGKRGGFCFVGFHRGGLHSDGTDNPGVPGIEAALRRASRVAFDREQFGCVPPGSSDSKFHETKATAATGTETATATGTAAARPDPEPAVLHPAKPSVPRPASRETVPALTPLGDLRGGTGDALSDAAQIVPGCSKETRRFASFELAMAVSETAALAAAFAGRPSFATAAVARLAKCFAFAPCSTPTDAALVLNLCAAVMPEGAPRVLALRRAAEMLEADAAQHRRREAGAWETEDNSEGSAAGGGGGGGGVHRLVDAVSRRDVPREDGVPPKLSRSYLSLSARALGGKRARFHETPPSPRSGPALCARAMACCARGDWVSAREAAAAAAALLERPGAADLRLCDVARCFGAVADVHLGRWESALASANALAHDRECHGEIGPVVLAVRIAAKTAGRDYGEAVALWRAALRRVPFSGASLGAAAYAEAAASAAARTNGKRAKRGGGGGGGGGAMNSRDYPAYVCCRAFAAQALWSAGERAEACVLLEQVCGDQLVRLRAPTHCLLPAAALAAGETVARAYRAGALEKKLGRRLFSETRVFLSRRAPTVLPFAAELAERLREISPAGFA
jgi:hypothetical protein